MREIKFIWVCRNKHFNEIHRVELTDTMLLKGKYPSWIATDNCEIIAKIIPLGSKDKNGKEIYEGDIVHTFSRVGRGFRDRGIDKVRYSDITARWYPLDLVVTEMCEVIGNIWENPDLI